MYIAQQTRHSYRHNGGILPPHLRDLASWIVLGCLSLLVAAASLLRP